MINIKKVTATHEMDAVQSIRAKVFIEEQQVPRELEIDTWDSDPRTTFYLAEINEQAVGCARIRPYKENIGKVERVAVLQEFRGQKIGQLLMEKIEADAPKLGFSNLYLNAQYHAKDFYLRLGYQPIGDIFEEAGIPHIAMEKVIK